MTCQDEDLNFFLYKDKEILDERLNFNRLQVGIWVMKENVGSKPVFSSMTTDLGREVWYERLPISDSLTAGTYWMRTLQLV